MLHKECNCNYNKVMVVTLTANCWFYRKFWAIISASLEFFWLILGSFYEEIGLFFNQHLATLFRNLPLQAKNRT